ncbi:MAG: septum formation initiator family protein [Ruminococcaceae bacterium]|nr:septum formation initiator family protein [Oscillospiraceae bacterium]
MTEATRMNVTNNINSREAQYNGVRRTSASALRDERVSTRTGTSTLERTRRKNREKANAPIIVKKRVKASPFPVRFVFYAVVLTIMLMFVIYGNSVMNELSYESNSLKSEIALLEQENDSLQFEIDKKYDLKYIEEVATTELGLVKSTDVVKHYVDISGGDTVEVSAAETKTEHKVDATFDSFKESVSKIYE